MPRQIKGRQQLERHEYANGTWLDVWYPWAQIKQARVMCADGRLRRTHQIIRHHTLNSVWCDLRVNEITVSGEMGCFDAEGNPSANYSATLLFRANPNGVNAHLLPVGWYGEPHG